MTVVLQNRRILLVDDMPAIHEDFRKILMSHEPKRAALSAAEAALFGEVQKPAVAGFELDSTYQGQEGLAKVQSSLNAGLPYAMAFVDMRMPPGWDGIETIERLWQADARLQIVICTAFSDHPWDEVMERLDVRDRLLILKKPFDAIEVHQLANALTAKWEMTRQADAHLTLLEDAVLERTRELTCSNEALQAEISERKATSEALEASEETFRAAMEHSSTGMALVEPSGRWLKVNNALCNLLGYSEMQMMQMNYHSMTHVDDFEVQMKYTRQLLTGELNTLQLEIRYLHRDGHTIWVLWSVSLVRHADTSPRYFVVQIHDITARKQIDNLKNEFISTVSHELRTPLTSIRGALGLIAGGAVGILPEKAARLVNIAHQNSERLVRIINDILDIEKIESGKMETHIDKVKVISFLKATLEANHGYGQKFGVRFVLDETSVDAEVLGDQDRLMQVMANLLSNAAKFSPSGSEVIVRAQRADNKIHFEIEDHGPGIPEAFHSRIFQKFTQVDASSTRAHEGTGLGLSIAKQMMEAMKGNMGFHTAMGKGSTFYFDLPEAPKEQEVTSASESSVAEHRPQRILMRRAAAPTQKGVPRVLHVEDDPDFSNILAAALHHKAELVTAPTLAKAEQELRSRQFDLVVLDPGMPDGSGIELLKRLNELAGHSVPVLILSASEVSREVRQQVAAVLVKSRTLEHKIVETVLALLHAPPTPIKESA